MQVGVSTEKPEIGRRGGMRGSAACSELFLRHSSLAQADEVSGFEQGADPRHPEISDGLQAGEARKTIVAAQPAGFGEFGGGARGLAFEGIGGGEAGAGE